MRVLVTGGAGFAGSWFVRAALIGEYPYLAGADVTVFDKLTYAGSLDNLADVREHPRLRFVRGDICSATDLDAAIPGHDLVVNFAAETHVDRSLHAPGDFVTTNVLGAQQRFDAAIGHRIARVVHVSTDEVYGPVPTGGQAHEGDPLRPYLPLRRQQGRSRPGAELVGFCLVWVALIRLSIDGVRQQRRTAAGRRPLRPLRGESAKKRARAAGPSRRSVCRLRTR